MKNLENQITPDNSGANDMLDQLQTAVKETQSGRLESFGVIYDLYIKKIYDYLYFRTHHKATAEDLTSLTFTKALQNIRSFNFELGTIQAWLYRIARNTLIDHFRTQKSVTNIEDVFDIKTEMDMETDLDVKAKLEEVELYLKQLPSEQRDLIVMRLWDNLSYAEISTVTGKSEASLKMSVSRILSKLRSEVVAVLLSLLIL